MRYLVKAAKFRNLIKVFVDFVFPPLLTRGLLFIK